MDQKLLKTSWKQRLFISIIAILLLGSTVVTYVAIVASGNKAKVDTTELNQLYQDKLAEANEYAASLTNTYFKDFSQVKSRPKAFNAEKANSTGVKKTDLKEGTGRELTAGDTDYFAYYIGWCADGNVFQSSFDDFDKPTSLSAPIYAGSGLIRGWTDGVIGMKLGGIRELTIPAELAYGESDEPCGKANSPLKFIVMAIADDKLKALNDELTNIYYDLLMAEQGIN